MKQRLLIFARKGYSEDMAHFSESQVVRDDGGRFADKPVLYAPAATVRQLGAQACSLEQRATFSLDDLGRCVNRPVVVHTRDGGMMGTFLYGDEYGVTVETEAGPAEASVEDIVGIDLIGV